MLYLAISFRSLSIRRSITRGRSSNGLSNAFKSSIKYAQQLINLGKDVYLIELEGKDPSEIGFEEMTKYLHHAKQLTFSELLLKKMNL